MRSPITACAGAMLLAAVLVAGCKSGTGSALTTHPATVSATPSASPARDTTAPPRTSPTMVAMLGLGRSGSRSAIPWSLVDRNWTAAQWAPNGAGATTPDTLFLVDPAGGRYAVAAIPSDLRLVDWSADLHRLLLTGGGHALIIDTTSGSSHRLEVPTSSDVWFAAPLGTTLLVDTGRGSIERLTLDGRILGTYSVTGSQDPLIPISSPDGSRLVVTGRTTPLLIDASTGRVLQILRAPAGRSFCRQAAWWSDDQILVQCTTGDGQDLWIESIDGSHLSRLTDRRLPHPSSDAGLGDLTAYRLDSGIFVLESGGCADTFLSRLQPDGSTRFLSLATSVVNPHNVRVASTSPTALELLGRSGCSRSTVLARYEPNTGISFVQLGGHVAGGEVIAAVGPASYRP